jgi:hypothetical protein
MEDDESVMEKLKKLIMVERRQRSRNGLELEVEKLGGELECWSLGVALWDSPCGKKRRSELVHTLAKAARV